MIENRGNKFVKDGEIDLFGVLVTIIDLIKKNIFLIGICIVIGIVSGVGFYLIRKPIYSSSMIAVSNTLPFIELNNIVDSWQTMIKKGDYDLLAQSLDMNFNSARKLTKIQAENIGKAEGGGNSFIIAVEVLNNNVLDSLQNAIVSSLENNEYAQKRALIKEENLKLLKNKIQAEIEDLDSVRASIKELLKEGERSSNKFLADPGTINLQIVGLYEKMLSLDASIKLIKDIQIIKSFTKSKKPDGPRLMIFLIAGILLGLSMAFIIIVIRIIKNKLRERSINSVYSE